MRSGCSCGARACASKKTLFALEQARADVARRRHRWRSWQTRFDPKRLVFIDETWIKTNMAPLRGWGSKGERLRGFGHMALRRRSRLNHPTWRMHQLLHQRRIRFRQSMNRSSPHRGHGFSPQGGRLNGEINVTSKSWEEPKVLMPDQILEIRIVSDRIRIARKAKHRDAGDLQQAPEPIGAEGEITEFLGAYLYNRDLCCKATGSLLQNNRALTRIPRPACPTDRLRPPCRTAALCRRRRRHRGSRAQSASFARPGRAAPWRSRCPPGAALVCAPFVPLPMAGS